jgi:hypothetical protein
MAISSPCFTRLWIYFRIASFTISRLFHHIALSHETWQRRNRHAISPSGIGSKTAVY